MGKSNKIQSKPLLNSISQDRAFVEMRQTVASPTFRGRNASGVIVCSSETMHIRGTSPTSEVNTTESKDNKTVITNTPSQVVVAEAAEASKEDTQETIRSSSRAEEGDEEVAGEAVPERPHDVHGADPGQPADTGNRNCNPFVHIEANTKPVLAENNYETLNTKLSRSF